MKQRPSSRQSLALVLAVILLATLGLLAWRLAGSRAEGGGRTVTVRRGALKPSIATSGRLVARRGATVVSSPAGGQVKIVATRPGEDVRRGDVLVVLDDAPARAEVARAERAVEMAETRIAIARGRAAADESRLPEVVVAENELDDARAALDAANRRLAATLILAPFDGLVDAVRVAEGAAYAPNGEALTMIDGGDLVVSADLDEVDRPLIAEGQEASVTVTAFPGTPLAGRVEALSGVAQSRGGTTVYTITVAFARPADLALRPGMSAEVRLVPADQEAVLLLPSGAVRRAGERRYVTVLRDGRPIEVEVRTGASSGGEVEIAAGLAEGDQVVLP